MKKMMIMLLVVLGSTTVKARAQSDEVIQLLLNVEKLTQLKSILSDLKKGYEIFEKGYNTVKDLSEGNFSLHKTFLDALMEASPEVRKYYKVAKIIEYQVELIKRYKTAYNRFKSSDLLNAYELRYLGSVYSNLMEQSLRNLDELANVVTSGKMRMDDEERLKAIDRIYEEMGDKLDFLRSFNGSTSIMILQRKKEKQETDRLGQLMGIK